MRRPTVRPVFDWHDAATLDRVLVEAIGRAADNDRDTLVRLHVSIAAELAASRCAHCGTAPRDRRDGLCGACHLYQSRTGELPDDRTLDRRDLRRSGR